MSPLSTAEDNNVLNHFTGKSQWAFTADRVFLGLSATTPTKAGANVTEPAEATYARVSVPASSFSLAANSSADNSGVVIFPDSVADSWAAGSPLTHLVVYDAITAGNFIGFIDNGDITVGPNTVVSIPIGNLDLTMGGT